MRKYLFGLVACFLLADQASALSIYIVDPGQPWFDLIAGGIPQGNGQILSIGTGFQDTAGPIQNGTFSGSFSSNPSLGLGTGIDILTPEATYNPITKITTVTYQVTAGYALNVDYAVFNPTPGSISVLEKGFLNGGTTIATLSFSENGSNFSGSLTTTNGFPLLTFDGPLIVSYSSPTAVSAVPLPPALPLFASALLALGIFGVYSRRGKRDSLEMAT
jgi:hypothetical protein